MEVINSLRYKKMALFWLITSSLIIFSILFFQIYSDFKKSRYDAGLKVNNIALIVSKQFERDFIQIDNILEIAKYALKNLQNENINFQNSNQDEKKIIIENRLKSFLNNNSILDEIILIDKNGFLTASSNHILEKIDVNDRDYFKSIKENKLLDKGFSSILISKDKDRKVFLQFNAIRDENRELVAILAAVINQNRVAQTLDSINKASNTNLFLLNKNDLTLQLSTNNITLNKEILNNFDFSKDTLEYEDNNKNIIASFRTLKNSPFVILSTLSSDKYLLIFINNLKIISIFLILFVVLSSIFFFYLNKHFKREIFFIKELKRSKSRFENMFRTHSAIMILVNPETGKIVDANSSALAFYGYSLGEIKELYISQINISLNDELFKARTLDKNIFNFKHKLKNSEIRVVEVNSSPIKTKDGTVLFSIIRDITKEKLLEEKLQKSYELQKNLINMQDNIIILTDDNEIEFANDKFLSFFNYKTLEDFKKYHNSICDFFKEDNNLFCLSKIKNRDLWIEELEKEDDSNRLVKIDDIYKNERIFTVNISSLDENSKIISFTDITNTASKNIKLQNKLLRDNLTNAYNREFFDKNYESFIEKYHTNESSLALAMLDIDHFKYVNDSFGHDIGDIVLKEFVSIINDNLRVDDYLIRWGGEEFILILKIKNRDDFEIILEKLRKIVEEFEFTKAGHRTSSFGGAVYKKNEDIMHTIKRADDAVYIAKQNGRNKVVIL